jgi:hypothetical protein
MRGFRGKRDMKFIMSFLSPDLLPMRRPPDAKAIRLNL